MPFERNQYGRDLYRVAVSFPSGSPTSTPFACGPYALGMVQIASGATGFWLGFQVSIAGGPYLPVPGRANTYGDVDVATQLATAQASTAFIALLPPYQFAADSAVLWTHDGTGSGIPQTLARQCMISMKS